MYSIRGQAVTAQTCGLCGHAMTFDRCGYAGYSDVGDWDVPLCHADDHDCYTEWTVHGTRPDDRLLAYARATAAITGEPISTVLNAMRKAIVSEPLPINSGIRTDNPEYGVFEAKP